MKVMGRKTLAACLLVAASLLVPAPLWACDVPVYRYALERWEADAYEVSVYHGAPLTAEQQAAVEVLTRQAPCPEKWVVREGWGVACVGGVSGAGVRIMYCTVPMLRSRENRAVARMDSMVSVSAPNMNIP